MARYVRYLYGLYNLSIKVVHVFSSSTCNQESAEKHEQPLSASFKSERCLIMVYQHCFHFSEDINNAYRHFCGRSIGVGINKIHRL